MKWPHDFVIRLRGSVPLVAVDVGARGDVPPPWIALDGAARVIAFEPDPDACARLSETYRSRGNGELYRALPVALSGSGGRRTLFVTHRPSGSSLLPPETALLDAYVGHDYLHPITERAVDTRSLGEVLDELGEPAVDLMKLDIQGAELEVVRGLGDARIDRLLAVELEACMEEKYRGQPTFCEIQEFMAARGFELFDLNRAYAYRVRDGAEDGYHRAVFGVDGDSDSIAGRLWDVDALYFRRPDAALIADETAVRKLATLYCTYDRFVEAANLVERAEAAGTLAHAAAREAREAIVAWHRTLRYRLFDRPSRLNRLARLAMKAVRQSDRIVERLVAGDVRDVVARIRRRAVEIWKT